MENYKAVRVDIEFCKTYATRENADKAVQKVLSGIRGEACLLRYIIVPVVQQDAPVRYAVLFIGNSAFEAGMHNNFNCMN